MTSYNMGNGLKVFNDGSGVAIFKEDGSTVLLHTDSLKIEHPLLFTLLKERCVCTSSIVNEIKAQGLLDVDYCYR